MAKEYSHRNLLVWQRAQELAHQIINLTRQLPQNWANAVLARQIISSATSIGANIAEGHGRFTPGAHGNHLSIAKGSAAETDSWLDTLRREGYLTREDEMPLHRECMEIIAMLTSKIQQLEHLEKDTSKRMREEHSLYEVSGNVNEPVFPYTADDYQ
jgi:four helix bundle protein